MVEGEVEAAVKSEAPKHKHRDQPEEAEQLFLLQKGLEDVST